MKRNLVFIIGLIAVTLLLSGVASAFAGGSQESAGGPVTLRFSYYANAGWRETYEQIISAFATENPSVKIAQEPSPWDSYWNKFYADAAAGTSPDVMLMSGAQFQQAASKGIFLDLGPFLKTTKLDMSKYFTEAQNSVYKGTRYGVTAMVANVGLAYIKDMFDKAGIGYPNESWTWDDLLKAAQQLTLDQNGHNALDPAFDPNNVVQWGFFSQNEAELCWWSFVAQNGGSVINGDGTECTIDQPPSVEALKFLVDMIYKYHVSPVPGGSAGAVVGSTVQDPFMTGKIAMVVAGNHDIKSFTWDVASLPMQKKKAVLAWTQAYTIYHNSKHPNDAWHFIEYLLGEKASMTAAKSLAWMPSYKPVVMSAFEGGPPAHMNIFVKELDYATDFGFTPTWFAYQTALKRALDPAWEGKQPVAEAARNAAMAVTAILQGKS
jgi:multiple sugar transport system substrate-binding protein